MFFKKYRDFVQSKFIRFFNNIRKFYKNVLSIEKPLEIDSKSDIA